MVKNKKKIIHFILDHRFGGPHAYVNNICKGLNKEFIFNISTTGDGQLTDIVLFNFRKYIKLLYPFEILINILLIVFLFKKQKRNFTIIFNVHGVLNIAPVIASKLLDLKLIWHIHETIQSFKIFYNFGKFVLRGSNSEIVYVAKKTKEVYNISHGIYLPGCVDANFWKNDFFERNNPNEIKTLLFIGNLNPLKGIDILLDALGDILVPYKLFIIGSKLNTHKEYYNSILKKIRLLKKTHNVKLLGWKSQKEVRKYLKLADIFILPSKSEACPISLLEAMSMEKICLVSKVGDIPIIIEDGFDGFLLERLSKNGIIEKLFEIDRLSNTKMKLIKKRARKKIIEKYSINTFLLSHKKLYN